jgi:Family of unknown function (DUF5681)
VSGLMTDTNDSADDRVGYGRPPKQHRFKKGQSGNPKGGRRPQKSFMTLMADALDEKVPVQMAGKRMMVSKFEVVAKQLTNKAVAGDYRSIKLLRDITSSPEWKAASPESNLPNGESARERVQKWPSRAGNRRLGARCLA